MRRSIHAEPAFSPAPTGDFHLREVPVGITINEPRDGQKALLGDAVQFAGTITLGTKGVELVSGDGSIFPAVTINGRKWFVGTRFNSVGKRRVEARALNSAGTVIGTDQVEIEVVERAVEPRPVVQDFGALVPIPGSINRGVTAAQQRTMLDIFGRPCSLSAECTSVTNAKVKRLLVTRDVGPFRVEGIRPMVEALTRIFERAQRAEPELMRVVGTAGVLCCRRVRRKPPRPPSRNFSNHSWGSAIDLTIKGKLDPVGNGTTQFGILLLSPFFNEERFFWGAGFRGENEDAMHFEASDELVRDWERDGLLA
jgi:D-alanyl-D-alanine carboxypeptidase